MSLLKDCKLWFDVVHESGSDQAYEYTKEWFLDNHLPITNTDFSMKCIKVVIRRDVPDEEDQIEAVNKWSLPVVFIIDQQGSLDFTPANELIPVCVCNNLNQFENSVITVMESLRAGLLLQQVVNYKASLIRHKSITELIRTKFEGVLLPNTPELKKPTPEQDAQVASLNPVIDRLLEID